MPPTSRDTDWLGTATRAAEAFNCSFWPLGIYSAFDVGCGATQGALNDCSRLIINLDLFCCFHFLRSVGSSCLIVLVLLFDRMILQAVRVWLRFLCTCWYSLCLQFWFDLSLVLVDCDCSRDSLAASSFCRKEGSIIPLAKYWAAEFNISRRRLFFSLLFKVLRLGI